MRLDDPRDWPQQVVAIDPGDSQDCRRCGKNKPLSEFPVDRRATLGVASYCKQCHRSHMKAFRGGLRREALEAYGGKCACCFESWLAFLVIDHVGGGGNQHRRSLNAGGRAPGGTSTYRWLRDRAYPPGFQVLCHNCNAAKESGGCPASHGGHNANR